MSMQESACLLVDLAEVDLPLSVLAKVDLPLSVLAEVDLH